MKHFTTLLLICSALILTSCGTQTKCGPGQVASASKCSPATPKSTTPIISFDKKVDVKNGDCQAVGDLSDLTITCATEIDNVMMQNKYPIKNGAKHGEMTATLTEKTFKLTNPSKQKMDADRTLTITLKDGSKSTFLMHSF